MADIKKIGELLQTLSEGITKELGGKTAVIWVPPFKVNDDIDVLKTIIHNHTGITWQQLKSPTRKREITEARHLFCWFAYKNFGYTLSSTGEMLGGRDHTTVLNAINRISDLIDVKDYSVCLKFSSVQKDLLKYEESKTETEAPALADAGQ